ERLALEGLPVQRRDRRFDSLGRDLHVGVALLHLDARWRDAERHERLADLGLVGAVLLAEGEVDLRLLRPGFFRRPRLDGSRGPHLALRRTFALVLAPRPALAAFVLPPP